MSRCKDVHRQFPHDSLQTDNEDYMEDTPKEVATYRPVICTAYTINIELQPSETGYFKSSTMRTVANPIQGV